MKNQKKSEKQISVLLLIFALIFPISPSLAPSLAAHPFSRSCANGEPDKMKQFYRVDLCFFLPLRRTEFSIKRIIALKIHLEIEFDWSVFNSRNRVCVCLQHSVYVEEQNESQSDEKNNRNSIDFKHGIMCSKCVSVHLTSGERNAMAFFKSGHFTLANSNNVLLPFNFGCFFFVSLKAIPSICDSWMRIKRPMLYYRRISSLYLIPLLLP